MRFHGIDPHALLESIKYSDPLTPRDHDQEIPRELERICMKSLSKRASDRYTSALDMADDLHRFDEVGDNSSIAESPRIVPKGLRSFDAHVRYCFGREAHRQIENGRSPGYT